MRTKLFVLALTLGCVPSRAPPPTASAVVAPAMPPGAVPTEEGPITGEDRGASRAFLGVPYAAPPVGALRFRPPSRASKRQGVLLAAPFGEPCPQMDNATFIGKEDCLTLNVFAPKNLQNAPVMVFMHGGGNIKGWSGQRDWTSRPYYDGTKLAELTGTVVVTINYRLGALGFLSHPSVPGGNYGVLDQIAALEWIQRNVAGFGGAPSRVTVFGESAGAVDLCVLLASPRAKGLFARAIMQSGTCFGQSAADIAAVSQTTIDGVKCNGAADVAACMRAVPAESIVRANPGSVDLASRLGPGWAPSIDAALLPAQPLEIIASGKGMNVPTIVGTNTEETGALVPVLTEIEYRARVYAYAGGSPKVAESILATYPSSDYENQPRKAYIAVTTDALFTCTARRTLRALAAGQQAPVHRYSFGRAYTNAGAMFAAAGAFHAAELPFIFQGMDVSGYSPLPEDLEHSRSMGKYWGSFATTGDPNHAGAVAWPRWVGATDPYLALDVPITARAQLRTKQCDFWDALF